MMRRRTTSQEIQRQLEMEEAQRRLDQERGEEIAIEDGRVEGDLKDPQRAPKGIREEWKPLKIPLAAALSEPVETKESKVSEAL